MTTLLLSEIFPPKIGGSGRWFWELYRRLPRSDYLVAAGTDPRAAEVDGGEGPRTHRLPLSFPTRTLRPSSLPAYRRAQRELRALVREQNVDRVHAGRCLPEGLLALALKLRARVPYGCYAHGEEVNLSNSERRPAWHRRKVYGSRELGLMVGRVLRGARFLIANSESTRSILTERWGLAEDRVHVLHPGVDVELFAPDPADRAARTEPGWSGRRVLLTVGRLQRRKGHDVLIEALPALRRSFPDLLYAIAGEGEERGALERRALELGLGDAVQFLGEIDDRRLLECYRQCDLFVLPNREIDGDIEGFGMVLLEAQACGRPVVAGASGGTAETMRVGETGLVVPCHTPEPLVEALTELLSDPARLEAMGRAARGWVVGRFGWDALAERAAEIFADHEGRA